MPSLSLTSPTRQALGLTFLPLCRWGINHMKGRGQIIFAFAGSLLAPALLFTDTAAANTTLHGEFDFSDERMVDSMGLAFPKNPVWEPG